MWGKETINRVFGFKGHEDKPCVRNCTWKTSSMPMCYLDEILHFEFYSGKILGKWGKDLKHWKPLGIKWLAAKIASSNSCFLVFIPLYGPFLHYFRVTVHDSEYTKEWHYIISETKFWKSYGFHVWLSFKSLLLPSGEIHVVWHKPPVSRHTGSLAADFP